MDLKNFGFETDADGIALLTWDMPGKSMNVIDMSVIDEIEAVVDHVVATDAIKGCVITSGKKTFSGGADLTMLRASADLYEAALKEKGEEAAMQLFFDNSRHLSVVFRKLETCGKPFAAAINGLCLGGAFELTLSCHHRVLAEEPGVAVGLPEIKVGLFPGGGGTQRVARLMQTQDALQMLFKGDQIKPKAAKAMNLVHELAPQAEIVAKAKAWIAGGGKAVAPWDEDHFKAPSGKVFSPAGMMVWPPANAIYRQQTHDNYPAAKAILHCVYEGLQLSMDQGLLVEARWFTRILRTKEAAAMIRSLFISMGELNKGMRRPEGVPATNLRKVGVIGAGLMGAGIANAAASVGMEVVLIDRSQEAAEGGKAKIAKSLGDQVAKGRMKGDARDALLARIQATGDYSALKGVDLVVEAVFEDRNAKNAVAKLVQDGVGDSIVFASNTSTLPITSLAGAYAKPEDFIGIHFFSPVEKMRLVEVITGEKTGDKALATALDFVKAIKKTPIVVKDARGFYANRCVGAFIAEGHIMLSEGVPPAMIENVAKMAGMPVGPLSLNDEVGIDLSLDITRATLADGGGEEAGFGDLALLEAMVEKNGRAGRKNGKKGFYDYPEGGQKSLWPGLADLQTTKLDPDTLDVTELKQRFLVVQALQAARAYEQGIIADPREADVGSIIGFGFAPFTGGTLSYIDGMGVATFVLLCDDLAKKHGPRFTPPDLLVDMAKTHDTFYGRFHAGQATAA
jgi:3-hydroxyacyl-CoA dehydrogenase/enoyl-CoA hydratase/3-hydroxybutyryl-CoA epimerase